MSLPIALELYSVRTLYREDLPACLAQTAALGYTGVECFGKPALPAPRVREALAASGLTLTGWHTPIDLLEGEALDGTLAYFEALGNARAIVPWMPPETFAHRESVLAFADRLNAIQQRLAPHGIALGYHNHDAEFLPLADGILPWALLMDSTAVIAQLDCGNALASRTPGLDVAALAAKWPGRAQTIHAKPYSSQTGYDTMIGEDDVDWPAFLAAAENPGGAKWIIVEYEEETRYGQFEGAALCLAALRKYM